MIDLRVFGNASGDARTVADSLGSSYRGFVKFETLRDELRSSDVLLAIMGFPGTGEPKWMRSSFTTKILDYVQFGKPVVIWGPSDCSPIRLARKTGFAVCCEDPSPSALIETILSLKSDASYNAAAINACTAARTYLNHDEIHNVLVSSVESAIASSSPTTNPRPR